MDISEKIKSYKTLLERIQLLFSILADRTDRIPKIAGYSGLARTSIDRYLDGEQAMRLKNIGSLIVAIHRFMVEDFCHPDLAEAVTIESMATGLDPREYRSALRVNDADQLIAKMSEGVPKQAIDTAAFDGSAYACVILENSAKMWSSGDQQQRECEPLAGDFLDAWINDSNASASLLLLGDPAIGITRVVGSFLARQAKRHIDSPFAEPLPVYLNLLNLRSLDDMEVSFRHLVSGGGFLDLNLNDALLLHKNRRIVFVLDGFDEMAKGLSDETLFLKMVQLGRLFNKKGKLIISSSGMLSPDQRCFTELFSRTSIGRSLEGKEGHYPLIDFGSLKILEGSDCSESPKQSG